MTQELALGIDIGGTNTSYGIVNRRGEIMAKGKMPTRGHATPHQFIAELKHRVFDLGGEFSHEDFVGVGIGAPNGSYYTGDIVFAPNLPWQGIIPMAKLMSEALNLKATLTNDANAAAYGEMTYGAAKGLKDFILVTLGTGVGSGFVANGELIYGHDGFAGELGHVIAVRNGRKCGCGRYGCLERYASATGVVITAKEWLETRRDATILRDAQEITARAIHEAAEQGDAFALELMDYTGMILGQTLADAIAITSPEAIIFFGGLANAGDLLFDPVRKHMEENLLNIYKNKVRLMQSALADSDAAILGASALVW